MLSDKLFLWWFVSDRILLDLNGMLNLASNGFLLFWYDGFTVIRLRESICLFLNLNEISIVVGGYSASSVDTVLGLYDVVLLFDVLSG